MRRKVEKREAKEQIHGNNENGEGVDGYTMKCNSLQQLLHFKKKHAWSALVLKSSSGEADVTAHLLFLNVFPSYISKHFTKEGKQH